MTTPVRSAEVDKSTPVESDPTSGRDLRGISTCWQYGPHGWHVYGAGPCFDTYEEALSYRDSLDAEGVTWRPQR